MTNDITTKETCAPCAPASNDIPMTSLSPAPYTGPRTVGEAVTVPPIYPPDGSKPFRATITKLHGQHFDYRSEDGKVTGSRLIANIIEEGGCANV